MNKFFTSRERVKLALNHKETDRVPIDLGSTLVTGIQASIYSKLKNTLEIKGGNVKVYDPFYSASEIEDMGFHAVESVERAVQGSDCILFAVGHNQFKDINIVDIARLVRKPACIVDGWRIFDAGEVKANKLAYYGVGLG